MFQMEYRGQEVVAVTQRGDVLNLVEVVGREGKEEERTRRCSLVLMTGNWRGRKGRRRPQRQLLVPCELSRKFSDVAGS